LYRQRMQIEESFRDMKSQHFGEGLERSRSNGSARFTVLVLIASLAAFLLSTSSVSTSSGTDHVFWEYALKWWHVPDCAADCAARLRCVPDCAATRASIRTE
ncbi:MAG: transposase, partial [Pseudomonadota bacterium]|nr:transposase [Pseudomonadota bacterium]